MTYSKHSVNLRNQHNALMCMHSLYYNLQECIQKCIYLEKLNRKHVVLTGISPTLFDVEIYIIPHPDNVYKCCIYILNMHACLFSALNMELAHLEFV